MARAVVKEGKPSPIERRAGWWTRGAYWAINWLLVIGIATQIQFMPQQRGKLPHLYRVGC